MRRREAMWHGGRDRNDGATIQGWPAATRHWKKPGKDSTLAPPQGVRPWIHTSETDVWFLASRTVRGYIFVVLNYQFHSDLLQQPQETNMGKGTHSEMEWGLKREHEQRNAGEKNSIRGQERSAKLRTWCTWSAAEDTLFLNHLLKTPQRL